MGNKTFFFVVNNFKNTDCWSPDNVLDMELVVEEDRRVNGISGDGCHGRNGMCREKTK